MLSVWARRVGVTGSRVRWGSPAEGRRFSSGHVDKEEESDPDFQPQVKNSASDRDDISKQIDKIVKETPVVLFMKGLPSAPQCGFSYKTVQILNTLGSEYRAFNVLSSNELREGIKKYSQWPTIPQLFVKGEFIGGCDIVEGMNSSGDLKKLIDSAVTPSRDAEQKK
uniref:Uncharacterized monothiol glutaredoxin ycf64 n=1 Tax=Rhodosorus marinus TaxID=101924 RepID=A0A7S2ZKM9_9RHOD|mmetsp:Transcript_21691/g.88458  ORF Transcript_21691/g.88458 Transcript_21691/m.88458 type:complete len:167 (+) Transcript_21691:506-1006(+)|eukprot:CAMPEP_0113963908 /NCGR_PEP_ID=MMETSP0011_2-20120614/6797_1 /TAXON_ID=101924 /ORGANISM="Rhodosorus marinus" /LENGTH=166 /DNA_ID=CAMNT_0000976055 /DNA_START=240 /DNA_END=740 /DNA_ORIENTATION=+ /assembly_acc=CAM_ASM_000156